MLQHFMVQGVKKKKNEIGKNHGKAAKASTHS